MVMKVKCFVSEHAPTGIYDLSPPGTPWAQTTLRHPERVGVRRPQLVEVAMVGFELLEEDVDRARERSEVVVPLQHGAIGKNDVFGVVVGGRVVRPVDVVVRHCERAVVSERLVGLKGHVPPSTTSISVDR